MLGIYFFYLFNSLNKMRDVNYGAIADMSYIGIWL